ncbi:MAG TPA: acyl carrier protein [Gemmatimonadales bacterium]|jgi:hypothetical protein
MTRPAARVLLLWLALAGCSKEESSRPAAAQPSSDLPPDQRDAEMLGREIFELVDRAVDYKGSHRGRPAASFRQMGIDSLTSLTVRRLVNLNREPVITVAFRRPEARAVTSCRGGKEVLEEAAINGGRFSLMCTTRSGEQPMHVGRSD